MRDASLNRLAELSRDFPELAPHLTQEMTRRARRFMDGVNLYRAHPVRRGEEFAPVVWQKGTMRLRDYAPSSHISAPVIFVIPSLINRFMILDLMPEHSLLRMLAMQGFHPLVVDWDAPGAAERDYSLGDYICQCLIPALDFAAKSGKISGGVHVVGYCMGGLLSLALAQLRPDLTRSLSLLATPWDFHAGYDALGQAGRQLEESLQPWLSTDDLLPVDVIQGIFAALQPMQALHKFSAFAARDPNSLDAARFVLTEDWLNDGVPLPAQTARECFGDWCARNTAARGLWKVGGEIIRPEKMTKPAYVVIPGRDRIVPPQSAQPLAHALPHAIRHEPMMGHIGIMASAQAPRQVWNPLVHWIGAH